MFMLKYFTPKPINMTYRRSNENRLVLILLCRHQLQHPMYAHLLDSSVWHRADESQIHLLIFTQIIQVCSSVRLWRTGKQMYKTHITIVLKTCAILSPHI